MKQQAATLDAMPDMPRLDPRTLGARIVRRRTELHIEQADIADRAKLSRSYISRLENGLIGNPKVFDLEAVAAALEMSLPELVQPDPEAVIETRFAHEWDELQRQTENLPPEIREQVLRGFRESVAILHSASDLARRN